MMRMTKEVAVALARTGSVTAIVGGAQALMPVGVQTVGCWGASRSVG